MITEKIEYEGWPNCVRLNNREIELVVTTDIGPRIVHFGFIDQPNLFHLTEEDRGNTGGEKWRIYGGHRLWLAPEQIPRSFYPDNSPVNFSSSANTLKLTQTRETTTGIIKEMEIRLSESSNEVTVIHRLFHEGNESLELSIWALSVLAAGGRIIVPQEPYGEGDEYLLPARNLALWQYTRMNDPRWIWGDRYIQAKHLAAHHSEQKIGVSNKQRWAAFYLPGRALNLPGQVFIKAFDFLPDALYPDFGSNNEVYINGSFLEMETLGPLLTLRPGENIEHTERWLLEKCTLTEAEASIEERLMPVVHSFIGSL